MAAIDVTPSIHVKFTVPTVSIIFYDLIPGIWNLQIYKDAASQDRVSQSQLSCIFTVTSQREVLCLIPVQLRNHKIGVYYVNIAC